jgi:hypothetical protein
MQLEGLDKLKEFSDLIGSRTLTALVAFRPLHSRLWTINSVEAWLYKNSAWTAQKIRF